LAPEILAACARRSNQDKVNGRRAVPREQVDATKALARLFSHPQISKAQQLAVGLAFWCGATPVEMTELQWRHVRMRDESVYVRLPYRVLSKHCWLELPPRLAQLLRGYDKKPATRRNEALFRQQSKTTASVSARTIARWITHAAHVTQNPSCANARALRQVFISLARERHWRESEITSRIRRSRVISPPLAVENFPSHTNLGQLETLLRHAQPASS
jgi:hypothetical protein